MFWILTLQALFVQLDKTFYSKTPFVWLYVVPSVLEGQQTPKNAKKKKKAHTPFVWLYVVPSVLEGQQTQKNAKKKKKAHITAPLLEIWSDAKHSSLFFGLTLHKMRQ